MFGLDLMGLCVFRWLAVAIFLRVILVVTEKWLSFGGWCCVGTAGMREVWREREREREGRVFKFR